jgi:hypothetical protein
VLRLRLSSFALSVTEYIAPVPQLSASGSAKRLVLAPNYDAALRALDRGVLSGANRPLSKQRISAVYVPQGAGESG